VRDHVLHRYQARTRTATRKDAYHKTLNKQGGTGVYFTPIIWFLILAEVAVLAFLTLIVFW
jgi:hypothetical protein